MNTRYEKVRCLEKIVKDNDIGKGLGLAIEWTGDRVRMLALKSIAEIRGDEAIESLTGIVSDPCVNEELKMYASKLLETLMSNRKNKKLDKAPV